MSTTPSHTTIEEKAIYADVTPVNEILELSDEDKIIEKRAKRKVDFNLIPVFGALYMMSFLDRSNIGNANLTTFNKDLGLVGNQFGAAVSVVYATYVVFEPVWAVLMKIITPKILLTGCTICWSALCLGTAFIKNYPQLMAIRVLLGLFESGMIPVTTLYLTTTYMRHEYVSRQTVVFVFSAASSAFGGLLAYGLSHVDRAGLVGWQWIFLVEGLISFCLVPIAWFWVPNNVTEAWWLNDEDKRVWKIRQDINRRIYDDKEVFKWDWIWNVLKDYRLYVHAVSHFGIDCTLYSLTTFMPTIISGLGFSTRVESQLLTVPVYVIGALGYIVSGLLSSKYRIRGVFIAVALCFCLLGYILLAAVKAPGGRYAGVFIAAIGLYTTTSLHVLWCGDNWSGHYSRAFAMGFIQLVGNSSGACIGFIFTAQTAPYYHKGLYFDIGMTCMSLCCTLYMINYYRLANKKKRAAVEAGASDDRDLGDKNPHYAYYL
ncbi:major facilitator superfamily domain-containing protein [Naematelia encephala]|uniref:Major facilitator superfamily domain-containing protein n=1 Tax=Naematelia encephala TaxID=71784 RepID=A0A1Y2BJW2_9TREE|nr:major facilitator superfamily domain-containing protein [Naematelia encephala]